MERKELKGSYVLDSSVVIKWFSQEEYTELALGIRDSFVEGYSEIVVPDLQLYEIANALRYNKNLKLPEVDDAVKSLIDVGIKIVVPTKEVMETALSIAYEFDLTVYDAYFIALAKELDFVCVTADKKLYDKIKKMKFVQFLSELS